MRLVTQYLIGIANHLLDVIFVKDLPLPANRLAKNSFLALYVHTT